MPLPLTVSCFSKIQIGLPFWYRLTQVVLEKGRKTCVCVCVCVVYAIDQFHKRLEACIKADGGHYEHLLWHCLPDIPVATHYNCFYSDQQQRTTLFSEPVTFEKRNKPQHV